MNNESPTTIDEYIRAFPEKQRLILSEIRETIKNLAPEAEEAIRYQMPTFRLNDKNLIHFAAFKRHIGIYPTPSGTEAFKAELAAYKTGKGSIQFQLDEPIPFDLIKRIVLFRIKEETK
jgi:uncharacterized protein YdhG (YjbR/CyaY superfamily)